MSYHEGMKKVFSIIFFTLLFSTSVLASEFCVGFERGYKAGYKKANNTSFDPFVPFCPFQPFKKYGDPQSDYEHGYIIGYDKGSMS